MVEAANRLNIPVAILDSHENPAAQISPSSLLHVVGNFHNAEDVQELASRCDVLTVEIEHVHVETLEKVAKSSERGLIVQPSPEAIRIIQDKYLQKVHVTSSNKGNAAGAVPCPEFAEVEAGREVDSVREIAEKKGFGYPLMLKSKKWAYDGKGNYVIKSNEQVPEAVKILQQNALKGGAKLASGDSGLYVEKWVPFEKELAVMVVRALDGTITSYPVVETIQKDNICHIVYAPAAVEEAVLKRAKQVAEQAISTLQGAGVFGVEMFALSNGDVLFNEIAPRPHNSGHYTIEACHTSQFEQHIRATMGLPLGSTVMKVPAAAMVNILGVGSGEEGMAATLKPCAEAMTIPGATVHLYGKKECRAGRKMGHITIVGNSAEEVKGYVERITAVEKSASAAVSSSASTPAAPSAAVTKKPSTNPPIVGIIMGSDSDLPTMKPAAAILRDFGVPFEITIVSAHRTPARMMDYAKAAHRRGIKIIIAAAGGAAHLPGMVAAITPLPVIGVPVALKYLDGQDSLYSIVQMPRGVPVATVAINNSTNAALLAVRMLGSHIPSYLRKMEEFQRKQERVVLEKVDKLEEIGWEGYSL
ncbi:phosphoribosylaminoimidazole carboxylase ade2 [Quaeritorhiza haematococci]|nr:phosphoribosylaminoimidazole carboxylase ade2 [Quaeritorhiza haematococci]